MSVARNHTELYNRKAFHELNVTLFPLGSNTHLNEDMKTSNPVKIQKQTEIDTGRIETGTDRHT